ncbi:hypothetical protein [Raoultella ornithinolytica]|uniref:hypothetical protein n=1 Tax=Raoultella ornithinolytica TaxID=54291 RepID=UPI00024FC618|nr:hypothetical protein [Raoultella ornithinolytica]EHT08349.1 hypothetical protein HMPREF9690_03079 [Raoultella ornithinolytica 10-5246]
MNIFDDNDYEKACKWYEHIRSNVNSFNIEIEKLSEQIALDLLENKNIDNFHTNYQTIVDNFETEFYHIIETYEVEQRYLPFLCMIIEEHADHIYDSTRFLSQVLSDNGVTDPQDILTFGYEVYEAIGLLNVDIEDVKEQTIYKYHKMDFAYHDWRYKYGERELMNACVGFNRRVAGLFKNYGFDKTCIPVLMAIIINETDHIYGFSDYGFIESLITAIENEMG